jgi:glyoxylase-like metal-dependent hydrolase (beta-lactamase superfamily II)
MQVYSIHTGNFKLDGGAMFGVVPKSIWHKLNPADENNLCSWAMRCLLIQEDNRLILVDNGIGNKQDAKFFSHYHLHGNNSLDNSLNNLGFHKDDITDVFLTHLHFDHCGGSISREGEKLVPAFKHARYWSHSSHWEWAIKPNAREKASFLRENILPIEESGQLRMVDLHQSEFPDFIKIHIMQGHTESMMLPEVTYKNKPLIFMADLLPSVAHLPLPYVMAYDMFPMKTLTEKEVFLKTALERDAVLFFEHDPQVECVSLQQTEKGIRTKEHFTLNTI